MMKRWYRLLEALVFANKIGGWVWLLAAVAIAIALRLIAASNNLWFDEVITVDLASQMSGPEGTFTEFFYDNNHYLNTLWVHSLGRHNDELYYRLPSIIAGVLTVIAVWWSLQPRGRMAQQIGAMLIAFSHVHVHYSTEARGYAMQILFGVIAFGCLERFHRLDKSKWAVLFGLFSSLSILSHLLSINFFLACLFWSFAFQTRKPVEKLEQFKRLALCHFLPILTGAALYLVHVRHLRFGGGPKLNTLEVAASAWSLLLGIAQPGTGRLVCGVIAIALVCGAILLCRKVETERSSVAGQFSSDQWRFFFIFLIVISGIRIAIPGSLLFVRYFLLQLTFGVILLAIAASVFAARTGSKRLVWISLGVIICANLVQNAHLINYGRGDYSAVVRKIAEESSSSSVSIGSTNNILDIPVLEYFSERSSLIGKEVSFCEPAELPDWLIVHRTMDSSTRLDPVQSVHNIDGHLYQLRIVSRASYLSGFEWRCYRRSDDEDGNDRPGDPPEIAVRTEGELPR